jgi:hypothetical protein
MPATLEHTFVLTDPFSENVTIKYSTLFEIAVKIGIAFLQQEIESCLSNYNDDSWNHLAVHEYKLVNSDQGHFSWPFAIFDTVHAIYCWGVVNFLEVHS